VCPVLSVSKWKELKAYFPNYGIIALKEHILNISIFGLGYVGCVSLGCLAKNGHNVLGVDTKKYKVDLVNKGKPTIIEKDLDTLIKGGWSRGKIKATLDYQFAVANSQISFICVATPSSKGGKLNLKYVYKVASQIGESLKNKNDFQVVVIRSTALPGTNNRVGEIIEEKSGKKRNKDFAVISNPEFMREGSAVYDYYHPPVVVIGSNSKKGTGILREVYADIQAPLKETSIEVAELIKYASNSFHALKVCFANEIGNICKALGVDSHELMELFCQDKKLNLSPYYLKPGFAYGGSCLPKDLRALVRKGEELNIKTPVLKSITPSNEEQIKMAVERILKSGKKKIGILGLSFKAGTDDLRESPTVKLLETLLKKGCQVRIYDQKVSSANLIGSNKEYIARHIPHLAKLMVKDIATLTKFAELVVIANKDEEFARWLNKRPAGLLVLDLVRIVKGIPKDNFYEGLCW